MIFSFLGLCFLVVSNDVAMAYLSLELTSLPLYVLAASSQKVKVSTEAGIKYFILGAFSSCLILYAIAQIYLISGTLNLVNLRRYFSF
jgi:NADH-quinone oxidoreductase subunit N